MNQPNPAEEFPWCKDCTEEEMCPHHVFLRMPKEFVGMGEHQHRYTVVVEWMELPASWGNGLRKGDRQYATKVMCACGEIKEL